MKNHELLTQIPQIFVDRKVKALLDAFTMEKFDSISDQIGGGGGWPNNYPGHHNISLRKATDEAVGSEIYARLCRQMMEQISSKVRHDGTKNNKGKPIAGEQLLRKYLLSRCQEDFEHSWDAKDAAATVAKPGEVTKPANDKSDDDNGASALLGRILCCTKGVMSGP